MVICQQIFSILVLVICHLNSFQKVLQDPFFSASAPRSSFGAAISVCQYVQESFSV